MGHRYGRGGGEAYLNQCPSHVVHSGDGEGTPRQVSTPQELRQLRKGQARVAVGQGEEPRGHAGHYVLVHTLCSEGGQHKQGGMATGWDLGLRARIHAQCTIAQG